MQTRIYELSSSQFDTVEPLFKEAWFDRAYIDSVFEGKQPARIFVDDIQQPTAALMCRTNGFYVAGDTRAWALLCFIKDAPSEAGVFDQLYFYFPLSEAWEKAITGERTKGLETIGRKNFIFRKKRDQILNDWRKLLPPEAAVVPIDRALAERIDKECEEHIGGLWGSYERYIQHGFGYCTMIDKVIASVVYAEAVSESETVLNVLTKKPFRRRGFATLTSLAFIEHSLQHGLVPTWVCDDTNVASIATARKLGFQEERPFRMIIRRPAFETSGGLWTKADSHLEEATGVTLWIKKGL